MAKRITGINADGTTFEWVDKTPMNESVHRAVQIASLFIERRAKQLAPVDNGDLKRSINTVMKTNKNQSRQLGVVGTNIEYAVFQEFGTKFMPAQPYLGPALEEARRRYG